MHAYEPFLLTEVSKYLIDSSATIFLIYFFHVFRNLKSDSCKGSYFRDTGTCPTFFRVGHKTVIPRSYINRFSRRGFFSQLIQNG